MSTHKNIINLTRGRLTARKIVGTDQYGHDLVCCDCSCGTKDYVTRVSSFLAREAPSCGCVHRELSKRRIVVFLQKKSNKDLPEYRAWSAMVKLESSNGQVCQEWRESFLAFFADLGVPPNGHAKIERKNEKKPYTKENTQWGKRS